MRKLRVGLAQINTTVGDLDGNLQRILNYVDQARQLTVDIISFPELAITGYPPEDMLLRSHFVADNLSALKELIKDCNGITAVVGFVDQRAGNIYNAAALIHDGNLTSIYHKQLLPNYGVFDEKRYFTSGSDSSTYTVAGIGIGINICEDIWHHGNPTQAQTKAGAEVILNLNGSPYHIGKRQEREKMLANRANNHNIFVSYVNQVGGQDELVFDGSSMIIDPNGKLLAQASSFEEELLVCDLELPDVNPILPTHRIKISDQSLSSNKTVLEPRITSPRAEDEEIYTALVTGTSDYVRKTGFHKALISLSGGIDSSLTACIAVDALGSENVVGVAMPSRYSSKASTEDAQTLSKALGIEFMIIPIDPAHSLYLEMLALPPNGEEIGTMEENLQARIRGNLVMALSNQFSWLVLTTGNKSEMAIGYTTLYGDMSGGFAVIKDVPKTLVYQLCHYRNSCSRQSPIPESVLTKPPSAELKPGQLDQDTLPPYEILDPILEAYVEEDKSGEEIIAMGFDKATVRKIIQMVNRNEYKRRQAPTGIKVTARAFGRDRRLPIANLYKELPE